MSGKLGRALNIFAIALLLAAAAARFVFPTRIWMGQSGATWAVLAAVAVTAAKLAQIGVAAVRRREPLTRLLLPLLVLLELMRLLYGHTSRVAILEVFAALELALIAAALVYLRATRSRRLEQLPPEEEIARLLAAFLPETVSRMVACELVVLWLGMRWVAAGFRVPAVEGYGYVEGSMAELLLPVIVPLLCVFETIGWEVLAHGRWPRIEVLLIVLDIWGILWCFGAYVAFRTRPHRIDGGSIRLRRGIFGECTFPPAALREVEPGPEEFEKPPAGTARMHMRGLPSLLLRFHEPVEVRSYFRAPRKFPAVLVSASDRDQFRKALLAACESDAGSATAP